MISILKRDSITCHNVLSCVGGTKINTSALYRSNYPKSRGKL